MISAGSPLSAYKGVWVWIQIAQGEPYPPSLELLTVGRSVADRLKEELVALITGRGTEAHARTLAGFGCDRVVAVEHPLLESFSTDAHGKVLTDLILARKPSIVLYSASLEGRDLASVVAARTLSGLAADCTTLEVNEKGQLVQIRPDYGGKSLSAILTPKTRPQMATVRPGAYPRPAFNEARKAAIEVIIPDLRPEDIRVRPLKLEVRTTDTADVSQADILVVVGRGLRSKDNLHLAYELAEVLGGRVGATLSVVERGWLPSSFQIGQTGKIVAPRLYIALGVSGAIQHTVGMEGSKFVIAINSDPDSRIFTVADIGIVGDLFEIVPELIKRLKEYVQGKIDHEKITSLKASLPLREPS